MKNTNNYNIASILAAIVHNIEEAMVELEKIPFDTKTLKQMDELSELIHTKDMVCEMYDNQFDADDTNWGAIWVDALPQEWLPNSTKMQTIKVVFSYCKYLNNEIAKKDFVDVLIDNTIFDDVEQFTKWYEMTC